MLAAPNVLGRPIRRLLGGLSALPGLSGSMFIISNPAPSGSSLFSDVREDFAEPAPGREKQCGEECRLPQKCASQLRRIASELICRANSAIVKGLSSFGRSVLALSRWEYPVARSNGSPGQTSRINSAKAKPVISGIA
jgi:hypothetical protein